MNLLTNAHEYCPEGASIRVTASSNGAEVEIAVSDNGPGIPADQLEHIFERFTRGDAGLTQRVGGTGLGLAISKSLVELHGGTIAAESVDGQGSTFGFRLPAERRPRDAWPGTGIRAEALMSQGPGRRRLGDDPAAAAHAAGDGGLRGRDRRRRPGGDRRDARAHAEPTARTCCCSTR